MKAPNPQDLAEARRKLNELRSLGWYHSIERPDGSVIQGFQTLERQRWRLAQFPIPQDLRGKRVLDIGAWDGWFSFEMEKRGASVTAVDSIRVERFEEARAMLQSKAEYRVQSVYDLRSEELGTFDIVLFLGVLYHLRHPLLALERVCALSSDLVCVESYVTGDVHDPESTPLMEFYEGTELRGQFDNWVGPNIACLLAFCRAAGFAQVKLESVADDRAHVTCKRKWDAPAAFSGAAPKLQCVENAASRDDRFAADSETDISLWFRSSEANLTAADVFPEVGPYGVYPSVVRNTGGHGWQAVFRLPPGLPPGWTPVRLRVRSSAYSQPLRIRLGAPDETSRSLPDFRIEIAADGKSWERNCVFMRPEACISLWVRGFPRDLIGETPLVRIGGIELPCVYIAEREDAEGLTQVNAMIPSGMSCKPYGVRLVVGDLATPPADVHLVRA